MLIKKDGDNIKTGVIVRGDFEPVSVENISTYKTKEAISNETEFEVENTYNTKFDSLKVFGKSEQKAKWYQAERAIKAGSYQVSAESGIYEVTIADDLIDTDDTNKDRICFDSISGSGYRENMRNGVKTRTPITFTKVESSTLPLLPWTAYGKQLIPFEPYVTNSTGSTTKDWPAPPFVLGETYYFGGGVCDDGTAINSNNSAFIILKDGVQVYNKSPNRAITITEDLLGADTVRLYTNSSLVGKTVTQFTGELGSSYSGSYEPFNPTPLESITPSSDYPQKFYDLSNVTVTSRGKNLFSGGNITLNQYANNVTEYVDMTCLKAGKTYTWRCDYEVVSGTENDNIGNLYLYNSGLTKWVRFSIGTAKQIPADWDFTNNIMTLYGSGGDGNRITNITNAMFVEGDTVSFVDGYRCTSATIPIESCCMEIDETLYDLLSGIYGKYTKDGKYYVCDYIAIRNDVVTYVKCINDETLSASTPFIQDGDNRFFRTSSSFSETLNQPYKVLCQSTHLPGITHGNAYENLELGVSKVTHTISISKKGIFANMTVDDFNGWLGEQYDVGMPVIVRSILNIPVETDCTDTWAQDLLGLKTAPYYTKLFADKEIGGISVIYKCFEDYKDLFPSPAVLIQKSLIGSDGKNIVTSDGNSVIAQ